MGKGLGVRICTRRGCMVENLHPRRSESGEALWQSRLRPTKDNCFTELCSGSGAGSYLKLIVSFSCITRLNYERLESLVSLT